MKRFVVSLSLILIFIIAAVIFDQWYMNRFARKMDAGLDAVVAAEDQTQQIAAVEDLNEIFQQSRSVVGQLVFSNRLEEVETVLFKLNAYIEAGDENEIPATVAELRARMSLLSSSPLYYRNQKSLQGINWDSR